MRNVVWSGERIHDATLVVREDTAHVGTLLGHWPEVLATLAQAPGTDRGAGPV